VLDAELEALGRGDSILSAQDRAWRTTRAKEERQRAEREVAMLDAAGVDHLHAGELDARVMKCDGRNVFAYNAQAVIDHESDLIVAPALSMEQTDARLLAPMVRRTKEVLGTVAKQTVADAGYYSGEQLDWAQKQGVPVLVEVQEETATGPYAKSHFVYDAERDGYVCPRGELLPFEGTRKPSGNKAYPTAVYQCLNETCPVRTDCSRNKEGRIITRTPYEDAVAQQSKTNARPENVCLRGLRKEICEHIFGCIKGNDGFRRFTVRGLTKAAAQWVLACLALNLRKLMGAWLAGTLRIGGAPAHR
jgi:hypothetical protein